MGKSMFNESFWESLQQVSQTACKREDTAEGVRFILPTFSRSLGGQTQAQRQKLPGGRLQLHLRKTFLTVRAAQQLNGLLGEVESLEVFKVERSPL